LEKSARYWFGGRIHSRIRRVECRRLHCASMNRYFKVTVTLICVLLSSCAPRLNAKILAGFPPTFHLDGNDEMRNFFICPDLPVDQRNETNAIWQISPDNEHKRIWPLDITYATVPKGFTQITPKNGAKPPVLEEDKRYSYHFVRAMGGGGGAFVIRQGTAVEQ
jgi:hypothetical protein